MLWDKFDEQIATCDMTLRHSKLGTTIILLYWEKPNYNLSVHFFLVLLQYSQLTFIFRQRRGAINTTQLAYLEKYKPSRRLKSKGAGCCLQWVNWKRTSIIKLWECNKYFTKRCWSIQLVKIDCSDILVIIMNKVIPLLLGISGNVIYFLDQNDLV